MRQIDPSDDFSFTLGRTNGIDSYAAYSLETVTEIFRARLDLFPRSQAPQLARHLLSLCATYRFDPAFILALIQVESHFHIQAISSSGAVGLMQVMPATAHRVVEAMQLEFPLRAQSAALRPEQLADPYLNLSVGVAYLALLRNHYRELPPYYLVAAYNAGPTLIDGLIALKGLHGFQPVLTKRYFEAVRRGVAEFRSYSSI